jgi:hypothetical protein
MKMSRKKGIDVRRVLLKYLEILNWDYELNTLSY